MDFTGKAARGAGRFVRFQAAERNERGGYSGVFGLVNRLATEGRLGDEEEWFRREGNRWYDRAYPRPVNVYERNPQAAAWFKAEAVELIGRVEGYLAILERHGVGYVVLRSDDPGRVVYEDAYQVVVVPYEVGHRGAGR